MNEPFQFSVRRLRLLLTVALSLLAFVGPAAASPALDAAAFVAADIPPNAGLGVHQTAIAVQSAGLGATALSVEETSESSGSSAESADDEDDDHSVPSRTRDAALCGVVAAHTLIDAPAMPMLERLRAFPGRGPPHL